MPQRVASLSIVERLAVASQRCFMVAGGSQEQLALVRSIKTLLERLTLADLGLTTQGITSVEPTKVKYVHICETDFFSMGVFILGKGARIPLHDHPNMTVLSKILDGNVRIRSFDWVRQSDSRSPELDKLAKLHSDVAVSGPSAPRALFAHSGNLHTFHAATATAMLDIQGPPYNDTDRECHYYRVVGPSNQVYGGGHSSFAALPPSSLSPPPCDNNNSSHNNNGIYLMRDDAGMRSPPPNKSSSDSSQQTQNGIEALSPLLSRQRSPSVNSGSQNHDSGNGNSRSDELLVYLRRDDNLPFEVEPLDFEGVVVDDEVFELARLTVNWTLENLLNSLNPLGPTIPNMQNLNLH